MLCYTYNAILQSIRFIHTVGSCEDWAVSYQSTSAPVLMCSVFSHQINTMKGYAPKKLDPILLIVFKWANPGLFFIYFWSFQTNIIIFTTNLCEKMSIQYTAPGFEPMTFECESLPITTRPGLPPINTSYWSSQAKWVSGSSKQTIKCCLLIIDKKLSIKFPNTS